VNTNLPAELSTLLHRWLSGAKVATLAWRAARSLRGIPRPWIPIRQRPPGASPVDTIVAIHRRDGRIAALDADLAWLRGRNGFSTAWRRLGAVVDLLSDPRVPDGTWRADLGDHVREPGDVLGFCSHLPGTILVPDRGFHASAGYARSRRAAARGPDFADRDDAIVWRGSPTGQGAFSNDTMHASDADLRQRVRMCLLLRDAGAGRPGLRTDALIVAGRGVPAEARDAYRRHGIAGDRVPEASWIGRRFAIDIDGYANAFSNLFLRLLYGCCVIKVASPAGFRQWYYDRLVPWEHYVPVAADLSDLVERIEWCRRNDDACRRIAAAGRALAVAMTPAAEHRRTVDAIVAATRGAAVLALVFVLGTACPRAEEGVDPVRDQAAAEREAARGVRLVRRDDDGPWCYDGPRFTLESTAGPTLTRQAVVRLESLLDTLDGLLPPAVPATGAPPPLRVRLCGTQAEYAGVQAAEGVKGANPAFYLPGRRLLVAGSDVPALVEQARHAADGLDATAARQRALDDDVATGLRRLAGELEDQGIPGSQRAEIVGRTRARWQREKAATLARVEAARRENEARVEQARDEFFAALAHEAWHAHADLRLGPRGGLPPWLDEGLAQVFETGLDPPADDRRSAPDPRRLARLAELLASADAPVLPALFADGERQFLVGHGNPAASSRRAYLLAWGVAHDLAHGTPPLSVRAVAELAGRDPAGRDDAERFASLVGMPLAEYEAAWRERMLGLARRSGAVTPGRPGRAAAPPVPAPPAAPPAAPAR